MKRCQMTQLLKSAPHPEIRSPDIRFSLVLLGHTTGLLLFYSFSCSRYPYQTQLLPHGPFLLALALPPPLSLPSIGVHLSNLPSPPHAHLCSQMLALYNSHLQLNIPKSNSLLPKQSPPVGSIYIVGITIFKTAISLFNSIFLQQTSIK